MKLKDKIILALILVMFSMATSKAAVRYILKGGDIIRFDLVSKYGVDSMAGTGLVGTDTELQYDSGLIYNKTEVDVLLTLADTGVQLITAGNNLTNSGTEKHPILDVDDVFYTKTDADLLLDDKVDTPHDHDDRYYTESELGASTGSTLIGHDTSHTVKDTFDYTINRGKAETITVSLTGGLGISWTSGELYDKANTTFFDTDAGSGNLTDNLPNYLKWVSGTALTISTSSASGNEILVARFSVYDGVINGYRETSLMSETIGNARRAMRALFPNRIKSGMSVSEDTDATNPLDVHMDAGELWKDVLEQKTPLEVYSRDTELIRHFHTSGVADYDTDIEIETTNYDNGTDLTAIPSNKWVKAYFIFMNGKLGWIYPTTYYNNESQALDASLPAMPAGLEPIPKLTAIVYQQGDTNFTNTTWQDIRAGISEESFNVVTDHGSLAGLSDDDHTQYHTDARGDARYYTETETDTLLSNKVPMADSDLHTHTESDITDLDKYTTTEVDNLLADKVDLADSAIHTHTESDITDLDKYTTSEVDVLLNDKADQADTPNWNTAYGWGNHADQNYFDTDIDDFDDIPEGTTYKRLTATKEAYIDQDVTSGSSPNFSNANMSGNVSIWTNDASYFDTDLHTLDDIPDGSIYKLSHNDFSDAYKAELDAAVADSYLDVGQKSAIDSNTSARHTQNTDTDLDATFEATFVKKADTVNVLSDITSAGADIEDAVTKKHTHANSTLLDAIAADSCLDSGQKAELHTHSNKTLLDGITADSTLNSGQKTELHTHTNKTLLDAIVADSTLNSGQKTDIDLNTTDRHASGSDNQNLWEEVRTDTGTISANSQTDTLWITGGEDVMVTNSGDTIIIDYTGTGGGGATAWGDITGTLSDQTDLEARFTQAWKERQLLAFRQNNYEYMIDGFNNPFDVENEGIDTALSDTYLYSVAGDYYYQDAGTGDTTELDYMEYADDDAAQAAYVSSDEKIFGENTDLGADQGTGYVCLLKFTASTNGLIDAIKIYCRVNSNVKVALYSDDSGEPKDLLASGSGVLTSGSLSSVSISPVSVTNGTSYWIGATVEINGGASFIASGGTRRVKGPGVTYATYTFPNPYESAGFSPDSYSHGYSAYGVSLQSYSEDTIKQQGSYSLKAIAVKDDSLADTIYHIFDPVKDLTDKTSIKLDTRATITGQNFSIKIHDSGGTTTTHAVTIADTSVYQTDTWDISGVSNANKDAIDQILIEIDNADTENTFYIDNIYGQATATGGGSLELFTEYFDVGITPTTAKALLFANKTPTSLWLTRTGTGTSLVEASLADTDIESAGLYAYTYTASVSGEASDTCIRCKIVVESDTTLYLYGISLMALE